MISLMNLTVDMINEG